MKKKLSLLFLSYIFLLSCQPSKKDQSTAQNPIQTDTISFEFTSVEALSAFFKPKSITTPLISAHRGGFYKGYPENCLASMKKTISIAPSILEIDIAMTRDSVLVLMHDNTLNRTSTGTGDISSKTYQELTQYLLKDNDGDTTKYTIPRLTEVLKWGKGKTVFTLDIKKSVPLHKVIDTVHALHAEAYCVLISYSHQQAVEMHEMAPQMMISYSLRNKEEGERLKSSTIPTQQIIAFTGLTLRDRSFYEWLHKNGITAMLGTIGNLDQQAAAKGNRMYLSYHEQGVDIFATDRPEAVAETFY